MVETMAHSSDSFGALVQAPQLLHPLAQQHTTATATTATTTDWDSLWRRFRAEHFVSDVLINMDTLFYLIILLVTPIQRNLLVPRSVRLAFNSVIAISAAALALCLFLKPLYKRTRSQVVLGTHLLTTLLRAGVFHFDAPNQAVLPRGRVLASESDHMMRTVLVNMVVVTAAPMRLFEVLGLQQPFSMHAWVALCFLAVHPYAALAGARLAYSNALFFVVHEVHDVVASVVEGLLSAVSGIPHTQQQTCSSCAGLVVYFTLGLFGSLAVPLYVAGVFEQSAFNQWYKRLLASTAGMRQAAQQAGLEEPPRTPSTASMTSRQPQIGQGPGPSRRAIRTTDGSITSSNSSISLSSSGRSMTSSNTFRASSQSSSSSSIVVQHSGILVPLTNYFATVDNEAAGVRCGGVIAGIMSISNPYVRWCVHLLVLVAMLVASWLVSNAVALVLLPRVLSSRQLDRWCPNRPYVPYVIAGQVYDGI